MVQGYSGGTYDQNTGIYVGGTAGAGVSTMYTDPATTTYTNTTGGVTKSYTRIKTLPKKNKMTYSQAGIPDEEQTKEPTISLKNVFTSTPTQRQTYVKETEGYNVKVQDYNKKIKDAKQQVDKYNEAVEQWNKEGRFQKYTYTTTTPVTTTVTSPPTQTKGGLSEVSPTTNKFVPLNIKVSKQFVLPSTIGMNTSEWFVLPKQFKQEAPKFGIGSSEEPPKQDLKLLFTNPYLSMKRLEQKSEELTKYTQPLSTEKLQAFGIGVYKSTIVSGSALGFSLGSNPVGTVKQLPAGIWASVNPVTIYKNVKTNPYGTAGEITGQVASGYALKFTGGYVWDKTKSARLQIIGTEKPSKDIFDVSTLEGKTTFPTAGSTKEVISGFERTRKQDVFPELKGKVVGVSASQSPGRISVVKTKAELGQTLIEDQGQYFSNLGKGSVYFTGLTKRPKLKFTLNPFEKSSSPRVAVVGFEDIKTPPMSVLRKPGFGAVSEYTTSKAGTGSLFVTKRGMLGKGELNPQLFTEAGKLRLEKGTTEIELISPATTQYSFVGKTYYTKLFGKTVPVDVAVPVVGKVSFIDKLLGKVTTKAKIDKGTSGLYQLSSEYSTGYRTVSPGYYPGISLSSSAVSRSKVNSYATSGTSISRVALPSSTTSVSSISTTGTSSSTISTIRTPSSTTTSYSITREPSYTPTPFTIYTPPTLRVTPTSRKTIPLVSRSRPRVSTVKQDRPYDTYVLEKGNWIKANKGNEKSNYYGALKLGADVTDNSSARSFKIKPTTGKVTNYYPYQPQLIKFYQPSKTGKPKLTTAFIEKTKYLIDTQGERQQITAKGIISNRRKTFGGFRL